MIAAVLVGVVLVVRGAGGSPAAPRVARPVAGPAGAPGTCAEYITLDELQSDLRVKVFHADRAADDPAACRFDLARGRGANLRVAVVPGGEREIEELRTADLTAPPEGVRVTATPETLDVVSGGTRLTLVLTAGGTVPALDVDPRAALLAVADRIIGRLPPFTPGAPVPPPPYVPPGPPEPCPDTVPVREVELALAQTVNQVDGTAANCSFWTGPPFDVGVTVAVAGNPTPADLAALRQVDLRRLPAVPAADGSFYESAADHGAVHLARPGVSVVVTVSYPGLPSGSTVPPGTQATAATLTGVVLDRL